MALTPQNNEAFMREVDDALRQDQFSGFWRRYGVALVVVIGLGLAAFGGWLYWTHHQTKASEEMSERFAKVLEVAANNGTPDAKELDAVATAGQPGYRVAGLLTKAGLAVQKGDSKAAIAIYQQIAADTSLAQPYRDLALIRQTALEFDGMKPQDIIARLKPLAVEGNPWFGSAGEMVAIAHMKMRKPDLAGPIFAALAQDENVPSTIRNRAVQMAGLLGVDAVITENTVKTDEEQAGNAQDTGN